MFELEADDDYIKICCEVFLTLKGHFVFHCLMCEEKFGDYKTFSEHFKEQHKTEALLASDEEDSSVLQQQASKDEKVGISMFTDEDSVFANYISKCTALINNVESSKYNDLFKPVDYDKWYESKMSNYAETTNDPVETAVASETVMDCVMEDPDPDYNKFSSESDCDVPEPVPVKKRIIKKVSGKRKNAVNICSKQEPSTAKKPQIDETAEIEELLKNVTYTSNGVPICTICNDQIKRRHGITQHMRRHLSSNKFICSICARGYESQRKLDFHWYSKHEIDEPANASATTLIENQCHLCKKILSDYSNLQHHLKRHNEENKTHQCPVCSKMFYTNKEMRVHQRIHTNERPYLCTECGSAFKTNGGYAKHILTHLPKEKFDFRCTLCNKACITSYALKIHMTSHKTIRDIQCTLCEKSFKAMHGLKQHMKIHENNRRYACEICQDRFNLLSGLRSHMKSKHQTCQN